MGKQLSNEAIGNKEKIVLELFGIDNKWVWSPSQKWVNMSKVTVNEAKEEPTSDRKWWQFWKNW